MNFDNLKAWDLFEISKTDIPFSKGVYAYIDSKSNIAYVGSAVGKNGLRGRIWNQHLNNKYLEARENKFSSKDQSQLAKKIYHNGKLVIEKSAFRKNVARKNDLAPGEHCLNFIKENFKLVFARLEDNSPEEIKEIEKNLISTMSPELNIRKY